MPVCAGSRKIGFHPLLAPAAVLVMHGLDSPRFRPQTGLQDAMFLCSPVRATTSALTGFRKIGFNPLVALAAVPVIHCSLSYPTQSGIIPDVFFSINTNNIHKCAQMTRTQTSNYMCGPRSVLPGEAGTDHVGQEHEASSSQEQPLQMPTAPAIELCAISLCPGTSTAATARRTTPRAAWCPRSWRSFSASAHNHAPVQHSTCGSTRPMKLQVFLSKCARFLLSCLCDLIVLHGFILTLMCSACRHDKDGDGKMTLKEIWTATETNKNWMDAFGWVAQKLEWSFAWCAAVHLQMWRS